VSFVQAKPIATHNFYGPVHKGLRLAQTRMLVRLGACGGDDAAETAALMGDLRDLLHIADHHLENEDLHVHTALEARAPGAAARLAQSHEHHRTAFLELEALILAVEATPPAEAEPAMRRLYLRFSEFMAEDFAHMAEEEQIILPVLQSLFTDEELIEIEHRIVSAIPPEQMMGFGALMIPAATRAGRIELLTGIRAGAPPEAFAAIIEVAARPNLSEADFAHLSAGLGL